VKRLELFTVKLNVSRDALTARDRADVEDPIFISPCREISLQGEGQRGKKVRRGTRIKETRLNAQRIGSYDGITQTDCATDGPIG